MATRLEDLLNQLNEETEIEEEPDKPTPDMEALAVGLTNNIDLVNLKLEALLDLGAILGLWNQDVIGMACENVTAYNKVQGPSNLIIERRQQNLKKLLAEYGKARKNSKGMRKTDRTTR
jgi:hypothetical protein